MGHPHFVRMDALLKKVCGFPPFPQKKTERMGHGTFSRIEASFPAQAELGWGTHFERD